ncbi:NAD(P)/FAD-dependent oxidoreductase [Mycobacterium sp. NPDC004974]
MPTTHSTAYERHAPDARVVSAALADSVASVFWLDDTDDDTAYPTLTSSTSADLTVVGGGYLGLWTAVLAKRRNPSARVVLLEAETAGWAASGRNGGFCEASLTHGESNGQTRWPGEYEQLERLGMENLAAMEADIGELGIECQWEMPGSLSVAVDQHQIDWLDPQLRLDREQTRAQVNSPLYLAAEWHREGCALVHPGRLARELARVAAELGVEVFEHSPVQKVDTDNPTAVCVHTPRTTVTTDRVALATNVFPSLLRRNRLRTVPVYDYVLMTEPLSTAQMDSIGWHNRQGVGDLANQFHYSRLTQDNRILYGGYDAIYHSGRHVRAGYEDRPESYRTLASHFLATYPQLEGIRFSHRWAGAIDTCTQFAAFHGLARRGRVAYAAGFTGLGVGATRFAAEVMLDHLDGRCTARTALKMVRRKPLPFPPEPLTSIGINATRWALNRADHNQGRRNALLRTLDAVGLGFDS